MNEAFMDIYRDLFSMYGAQGWWPVTPTCTVDKTPLYSISTKTEKQKLEIAIGAILTQNTAWKNVMTAIMRMSEKGLIDRQKLRDIPIEELAEVIRPAGYFNQKAKKLKAFIRYDAEVKGKYTREGLLEVWGLGPETVDCIMLYSRSEPYFVVDAYTRRFFENLGYLSGKESYDEVQHMFHQNLKKDVRLFGEYHALLVEHAKNHYSKKPWGLKDPFVQKYSLKIFNN